MSWASRLFSDSQSDVKPEASEVVLNSAGSAFLAFLRQGQGEDGLPGPMGPTRVRRGFVESCKPTKPIPEEDAYKATIVMTSTLRLRSSSPGIKGNLP